MMIKERTKELLVIFLKLQVCFTCLFIHQVEHFEDQIQNFELFKLIYDIRAGKIEHYLIVIYHNIIQSSIKKHSKRSTINEVF